MSVDLAELVSPWRTAVVTSEMQNGVIGEQAALPELAAVARAGALPATVRLVGAARRAGVEVVHALFERRPDGKGSNTNARLFHAVAGREVKLGPGSAATEGLPGRGRAASGNLPRRR